MGAPDFPAAKATNDLTTIRAQPPRTWMLIGAPSRRKRMHVRIVETQGWQQCWVWRFPCACPLHGQTSPIQRAQCRCRREGFRGASGQRQTYLPRARGSWSIPGPVDDGTSLGDAMLSAIGTSLPRERVLDSTLKTPGGRAQPKQTGSSMPVYLLGLTRAARLFHIDFIPCTRKRRQGWPARTGPRLAGARISAWSGRDDLGDV